MLASYRRRDTMHPISRFILGLVFRGALTAAAILVVMIVFGVIKIT